LTLEQDPRRRHAPPAVTSFGDPTELRATLGAVLESSEAIERIAPAVGSTLVLTGRRLLLVRQGASFRPQTGVRWWPVDRDLVLRLGRPSRGSSQLVIAHPTRTISVFLSDDHVAGVTRLIADIRRRAFSTTGTD
jgi:hypothetical protein